MSTTEPMDPPEVLLPTPRRSFAAGAGRYGMFSALVVVLGAAQIVYPGFWEWGNLQNVLSQNAALGVMAVGMTLVMIAGGFDLSVGAVYSCGAVTVAALGGSHPLLVAVLGAVVLAPRWARSTAS